MWAHYPIARPATVPCLTRESDITLSGRRPILRELGKCEARRQAAQKRDELADEE